MTKTAKIEWVRTTMRSENLGSAHWSRLYEYPWILDNGKFYNNLWVLDAGGGRTGETLRKYIGGHVINVDIEKESKGLNISLIGDIRKLDFINSNCFDRVVCCSVLEHVETPLEAVKELWRVLAPGGRLLITMDVAEYARYNHTISDKEANEILQYFGLPLPPAPQNTYVYELDEIDPTTEEPKKVKIRVLCVYVDK